MYPEPTPHSRNPFACNLLACNSGEFVCPNYIILEAYEDETLRDDDEVEVPDFAPLPLQYASSGYENGHETQHWSVIIDHNVAKIALPVYAASLNVHESSLDSAGETVKGCSLRLSVHSVDKSSANMDVVSSLTTVEDFEKFFVSNCFSSECMIVCPCE